MTNMRVGFVNKDYQRYQLYRYINESLKYSLMEWNLKTTEQEIVDGYVAKQFFVALLDENGLKSLQVHTISNSVTSKLLSALPGNISSFDCFETDNLLQIYAIQANGIKAAQNGTSSSGFFLVEKDISLENQLDYERFVYIDNCGTKVIALQKILVIACPSHANSSGKVTIVIRETLKVVKEYLGEYKD